jgi:carbon starvation protein CstA
MSWLIAGVVFLIVGYFTYGKLVEKILQPDDRATPAVANPDGVDYVVLPQWKNMLIQLLNIAGVGPVIGVIAGIKFGKVALLIIPLGCVLMGAVHDFIGGMMSLRSNGANLPKMDLHQSIITRAKIMLQILCFVWLLPTSKTRSIIFLTLEQQQQPQKMVAIRK